MHNSIFCRNCINAIFQYFLRSTRHANERRKGWINWRPMGVLKASVCFSSIRKGLLRNSRRMKSIFYILMINAIGYVTFRNTEKRPTLPTCRVPSMLKAHSLSPSPSTKIKVSECFTSWFRFIVRNKDAMYSGRNWKVRSDRKKPERHLWQKVIIYLSESPY